MKKVEILPICTLQLKSLTYRPTTTNKQSPTQPLHLPRNPNLKHLQENKKSTKDLIVNHSQLFYCAKLWTGLIKTNLRTNKIFRLADCILRFAVSLSENIFQECLHENSENKDNHKAPNLLRHLPFCSRLYSTPFTYLLWSSILFATFNCLHDLCQRALYQAIPGVSPFIQILKTGNWNKSALVHRLERNHADSQQLKICPRCLYDSLPCPSLKKEGSKQNAGSPVKSLKR